jgi:phage terminase small subunit
MALSERERRFIEAYMGPAAGNGTEAARLAGYTGTPKVLAVQATRLLSKAKVQAEIAARQQARCEKADIDVARVVKELARIGLSDVRKLFLPNGSLKPIKDWDDETAAAVAGLDVVEMAGGAKIGGPEGVQHVAMYTKKLKLWDKNSALEKIAKHLGMFIETVRHQGEIVVTWQSPSE